MRGYVLPYTAMCRDKRMLADPYSWQNDRHSGDGCVVTDLSPYTRITRWMRIIREYNIGKHPDEIAYFSFLTNMYVAVRSDVVSNFARSLNIGECTDLQVYTCARVLTHGHTMTSN